jgi:AcrR family transcriptional regulator
VPANRVINQRKRPVQERSKATVSAILEAAAQVLVERGFDGASTNLIARRAGVSIGSLYQYFPNKESLVAALIERHFVESMQLMPSELREGSDVSVREAVRLAVDFAIEAHRKDPELHQVLMEQVPRIVSAQVTKLIERMLHGVVYDYLEVHRDEIRPRNLRIASFIMTQMIEGLTHGAVVHHPEYLVGDELAEEMTELALRYLEK